MIMDNDQAMRAMAMQNAISRAGRKFITLRLIDMKINRIQGAIILHSQSYTDADGMMQFHFEERGGPIRFEFDQMNGGMFAKILDCEHNRKFLASMFSYGYWEIEDKAIESQIKVIADEMTKKAIKIVEKAPQKIMSDDEIETNLAKLNAEKALRTIRRSELKNVPVRAIADYKAASDKPAPEEVVESVDVEVNPDELALEGAEDSSGEAEEVMEPEGVPAIHKRSAKRRKTQRSRLVTIKEPEEVPA